MSSLNEYDFTKIKERFEKDREEVVEWLKKSNRDLRITDSFVFRISFSDMGKMIKHIEELQSMVEDDGK
jgi:hypothetical protein